MYMIGFHIGCDPVQKNSKPHYYQHPMSLVMSSMCGAALIPKHSGTCESVEKCPKASANVR